MGLSSVLTAQLSLDLVIGSEVIPELYANPGTADEFATGLAGDISGLMAELGLPGRPAVSLRPADDAQSPPTLKLPGHRSRLPRPLWQMAHHLHGADLPFEDGNMSSARLNTEVLRAVCLEFLKLHPELLVADEQVDLLARTVAPAGVAPSIEPERLARIVKAVVALGISLRDVDTVRTVLAESSAESVPDATEALVDALGAPTVELHVAPDLLRRLLELPVGGTAFASLREALFTELGVELPSLRLVEDPALPAGAFSVKINALQHIAWRALPHDHVMVNGQPDTIREFGFEATPWLDPQADSSFAIVPAAAVPDLQQVGWQVWDQLEHVAFCCLETLRACAPAVVTRGMLDRRLELMRLTNPQLIAAFEELGSRSILVDVCRHLVDERLSIDDLATILERWFECAVSAAADDRPAALIARIRQGLARKIAARFGFGARASTLVVYLVAPELEADVRDAVARLGHSELPCTDLGERLADAVRAELGFLSPRVIPPAILTTADVRAAMRHVIAYEFPRIAVLSYNELPPTLNVQPVARIGVG